VTSRSQRVFALAFTLLVVYTGSPALHMEVIGPHDHSHSTPLGDRPAVHRSHVNLPEEAQKPETAQDDQPLPTTQSILHCDLGVNPAATPPSFAFEPPGYVEERNARPAPSPSSLTLDPPSLPPRQA
jgi:hypothetical protein